MKKIIFVLFSLLSFGFGASPVGYIDSVFGYNPSSSMSYDSDHDMYYINGYNSTVNIDSYSVTYRVFPVWNQLNWSVGTSVTCSDGNILYRYSEAYATPLITGTSTNCPNFDINTKGCPTGYFYDNTAGTCKARCTSGFTWNGTGCVSACGMNEYYSNGSCLCVSGTSRDVGGACSSCPWGMSMYSNGTCYSPCPVGTVESISTITKAQICRSPRAENYFVPRYNYDGSLDSIDAQTGAFIRYDENGNPIAAYDSDGNQVALPSNKAEFYGANPRGSIFNPIIGVGIAGAGYLITAGGVLAATAIAPTVAAAGAITVGAYMIAGGTAVAISTWSNNALSAGSGSVSGAAGSGGSAGGAVDYSGGGIEISLDSFDISSMAPNSSTTNADGSVTKVTKTQTNKVISDTSNTDGTRDIIVADNNGNIETSLTLPQGSLDTPTKVDLKPETAKPIIFNPITKPTGSNIATNSNNGSQYQYDSVGGGYMPTLNPTSGGTGTSGSGTTSGTTSGTGTGTGTGTGGTGDTNGSTSGAAGSGDTNGTANNGQTSGAAGTGDGLTAGTFGDGFGALMSFADWSSLLSQISSFGSTVSGSFTNLKNSFENLQNGLIDGNSTARLDMSLGSGSCDSCNLRIDTSYASADLTEPLLKVANVFRPFIAFLIFVFALYISAFALLKTLRGGNA